MFWLIVMFNMGKGSTYWLLLYLVWYGIDKNYNLQVSGTKLVWMLRESAKKKLLNLNKNNYQLKLTNV